MSDNSNTIERRAYILDQLDKKGSVSVNNLSDRFKVSLVTIRKDLSLLEKNGLLVKSRGGAIKVNESSFALSFNQKLKHSYEQKKLIASRAIDFISEGDSVIMDSGTTTWEIAKRIMGFKKIKVITNSLPIAETLSDTEGVELYMMGGKLRKEMHSMVGPLAEFTLSKLFGNVVFMGVDGLDYKSGIFTPDIEEASLSRAMINRSEKVVVVTDSSKFSRTSMSFIASAEEIDYILTDEGIPEKQLQGFIEKGVKIIIV